MPTGARRGALPSAGGGTVAEADREDFPRRAEEAVASLRTLRRILLRLGAPQAGRYWRTPWAVFTANLAGGAAVGAFASIVAGLLLDLDIHRGDRSLVVHVLRAAQHVFGVVRSIVEGRVGS